MSQILLCQKLKDLLVAICEGERNLDRQRQFLCEMGNFTPLNSFNVLDRLQLNYLTHTDIHNLFCLQKMNISYEDTCLLLKNIDKNSDLKIMFEEWEDLLLCRKNYELRQAVLSRIAQQELKKNDQILSQIVMVLSQIIRNAKDYDIYRQRLSSTLDYSNTHCFNLIDIDQKGYIQFKDIDRFLKERGKYLSEEEILQLIQFADVDQDDALNFQEFSQLVLVGAPAPVQTSPKKSRIIQSPRQGKQQIIEPVFKQIASPYKSQFQEQQQLPSQINPIQQISQIPMSTPVKLSRIYSNSKEFSSQKKRSQPVLLYQRMVIEYQEGNEQLIQLLKRMIEFDRLLIETKNQLTVQPDFNLMNLYRLIDVNQNENISQEEFEIGANSIGLFPTKNQIFLFFQEFDRNKDGLMEQKQFFYYYFQSFGDFAQIFYTNDNYQTVNLNNKKVSYVEPLEGQTVFDIFCTDTRLLIKNLFMQIFDTQTALDHFRQSLQLQPKFNLFEAFKYLSNSFNELTYEGLKESLENYGVFTTENEMVKLFQKIDKDKDGVVRIEEFAEEIRVKSPNRQN